MGRVKARYLNTDDGDRIVDEGTDDLWPGQCATCRKDEAACRCDDDMDAPLIGSRATPRTLTLTPSAMQSLGDLSDAVERKVDDRWPEEDMDGLCRHGRLFCRICDMDEDYGTFSDL